MASGLDKEKDETKQINTLIYTMRDAADDILKSFKLSSDDAAKYGVVKDKFDQHFVKKHNVIFERVKFNRRVQREGETVDSFVTDLYCLAEHCNYDTLHDETIRDRIVVGLKDFKLSEKLENDSELTLAKAIQQARQTEAGKNSKLSYETDSVKKKLKETLMLSTQLKRRRASRENPGGINPKENNLHHTKPQENKHRHLGKIDHTWHVDNAGARRFTTTKNVQQLTPFAENANGEAIMKHFVETPKPLESCAKKTKTFT